MKKNILLLFICFINFVSFAQNKPKWFLDPPSPGNPTYKYFVGEGTGQSEETAKDNAIKDAYGDATYMYGNIISIKPDKSNSSQYIVQTSGYNIPIKIACKQYEDISKDKIRCYILIQVPLTTLNKDWYFDECEVCNKIDHSEDWRAFGLSVFPGLGQIIVKKNKPVGYAFMIGDLALIGGGVYCLLESNNQYDISQNPNYTSNYRQDAYDNYKMLDTSSKILFGAAAAVYVINLYTAYKMPKKTNGFALTPKLIPENNDLAFGIGISYNF